MKFTIIMGVLIVKLNHKTIHTLYTETFNSLYISSFPHHNRDEGGKLLKADEPLTPDFS